MVRPPGASDCEGRSDGPVAQPVNTLTSVAYLAAAAWLMRRSRRLRPRRRWRTAVFGAALAAIGIGSIAYHGVAGERSRAFHDAALAGLLAVLPVDELARRRRWGPVRAAALWAAVVLPATATVTRAPAATTAVTGALVGVGLAAEADRRRTGGLLAPPERRAAARRSEAVATVAAVTGLAAYVFGRTESPLCDPSSRLQLHGAWHILSAVGAAAWAERALVTTAGDPGPPSS